MTHRKSDDLRFSVRLQIKHPNIDPDKITTELGLAPQMLWRAGDGRKTPAGTSLQGVYETSAWGYAHPVIGSRFFFEEVSRLLERVEAHARFLTEITETGGSVSVYIHLPGDTNIGDVIKWQDLKRLAALQIQLGVEVFPKFN